jgi:hypothetical protein
MKIVKVLGTALAAFGLLAAQVPEDPVLKARGDRGLSANLSDSDLPPVPRAVTEPPPLPPPETHVKDMQGYRRSRRRGIVRKKLHRSPKSRPRSVAKRTVKKKR